MAEQKKNTIQNFDVLTALSFHKVVGVSSAKTLYDSDQIIYELVNGVKLFGRSGINRQIGKLKAPFFFQYRGRDHEILYSPYILKMYASKDELVRENLSEITNLLSGEMKRICKGCEINDPSQDHHTCLYHDPVDDAVYHLNDALEHSELWNVGDICTTYQQIYMNSKLFSFSKMKNKKVGKTSNLSLSF